MDEDTETAVLEIQLQDLSDLIQGFKGKQAVGKTNDFEFACRTQFEEINTTLALCFDRRMCLSISRAVQDDSIVLSQLNREESSSFRDRQLARRLAGLSEEIQPSPSDQLPASENLLSRLSALNLNDASKRSFEDSSSNIREELDSGIGSSSGPRYYHLKRARTGHECVACTEQTWTDNDLLAPCSHHYCRECMLRLFKHSVTDDSLFPARCCSQPIPVSLMGSILDPNLIQRIEEKRLELDTSDRTYYAHSYCATFIPPHLIHDDTAVCPVCLEQTCSLCKQPAHGGDCPKDVGLQTMLSTAQEAGWQRCYQCKAMVELVMGCNHITCRCRAQFCYVCGEKWKKCNCLQWDENRLYSRAAQIVDRNTQPRQRVGELAVVPRARQVENMAERLRTRHECNHSAWRRMAGRFRCEDCRMTLPQFILECPHCNLRSCVRCAYNRW